MDVKKPQVFIDCDGVLADFDKSARAIFGRDSREVKAENKDLFWDTLQNTPNFFFNLDKMSDADLLVNSVRHLNPIILTGCPHGPRGVWGELDKHRWAKKHFPGIPIITCRSQDKRKHMKRPGDILIDDWPKYQPLWEEAGGIFIVHTDAVNSIYKLMEMRVL